MKDYEQIGNCNDTYCKYYDESMKLNCSYSEDNTKCIRKEKADGDYAVLADVRAMKLKEYIYDDDFERGVTYGYNEAIDDILEKISEYFS